MSSEAEEHKDAITLTRFLLQERQQFTGASGEFAILLQSLQLACKAISNQCRKIGIAKMYGISDDQTANESGDVQKKLDVFSNEVFINCMNFSQQVYIMGSEENEGPIIVQEKPGGYAIVFDPLDGSSNIDCNISVGTIFGIYKKAPASDEHTAEKHLLRPGSELIAAGYCLYGSATVMVLTTGLGVNVFMLDPALGEFILTSSKIQMPTKGNIYSVNEGYIDRFDAPTKEYLRLCHARMMKARYVGSMVADVHRTLLYGGVYMYPGSSKDPRGKLRLLYECNPIAMLMEQAGGLATTGTKRVLDVQPTSLHGRSPIFCGSKENVEEIQALYQRASKL
eukprot:CAMPEP_0205819160 /NCGR_PEP_ID=MMETSP0206-20130828/1420_1 /ASSEMBLY_ACC=CAM_ASM_000279 /TAXON_ID=36767 /ORGANISM="Euplotes focardii, Strain TN1" /LENGTH=337 /DNA_ID=CAMNT_0053112415 /DNA_START=24 /DNA_END=1037 /DNA_ORIENTATION=+